MNSRIFWKIRSIIKTLVFSYRKMSFSIVKRLNQDSPFAISVLKMIVKGLLSGLIIAAFLYFMDYILINKAGFKVDSTELMIELLIGSIGISGVMFGLYCSSISAIYSTKYVNAPTSIRRAFQSDTKIQKCTGFIINYIILGLIIIGEAILIDAISWASLIATLLGTIGVIVSFRVANYRTYELSDVFSVGDDACREIYRIITGALIYEPYSSDINFQVYSQTRCEKQISLLYDIVDYCIATTDKSVNPSLCEYMSKIVSLVSAYWNQKNKVSRNSVWYKIVLKYKRWHLANDFEISTALQTGTGLQPNREHDYWWFEDALFAINKEGVRKLCSEYDFGNLYKYLSTLRQSIEPAITAMESNYIGGQISYIQEEITTINYEEVKTDERKDLLVGMVDMLALLYLEVILSASRYLKTLNLNALEKSVIDAIKTKRDVEKIAVLRSSKYADLYSRIKKEKTTEGSIVTPDWVIAQTIAKEQFAYINNLTNFIRECLDNFFNLGITFDNNERMLEAYTVFIRFYEVESKVARYKSLFKQKEAELLERHIDIEDVWNKSTISELSDAMAEWKTTITPLVMKNASLFAVQTWDKKDEYPDMLGDCYNHLCEDAVEAIAANDNEIFSTDYESLTKLMLLYQEYIRSDFVDKKDLYRIEYQYYMFTSPIIEWAQIAGLAILWGEFNEDTRWKALVNDTIVSLFSDEKTGVSLVAKLIEYVQNRDKFWIGVGQRDVLETGWNMCIADAIRNSEKYETDYENFRIKVKTNSLIFDSFCHNFDEFGFMENPAEVFWVVCVNPMLPEDQRFKSRFSWEEALND